MATAANMVNVLRPPDDSTYATASPYSSSNIFTPNNRARSQSQPQPQPQHQQQFHHARATSNNFTNVFGMNEQYAASHEKRAENPNDDVSPPKSSKRQQFTDSKVFLFGNDNSFNMNNNKGLHVNEDNEMELEENSYRTPGNINSSNSNSAKHDRTTTISSANEEKNKKKRAFQIPLQNSQTKEVFVFQDTNSTPMPSNENIYTIPPIPSPENKILSGIKQVYQHIQNNQFLETIELVHVLNGYIDPKSVNYGKLLSAKACANLRLGSNLDEVCRDCVRSIELDSSLFLFENVDFNPWKILSQAQLQLGQIESARETVTSFFRQPFSQNISSESESKRKVFANLRDELNQIVKNCDIVQASEATAKESLMHQSKYDIAVKYAERVKAVCSCSPYAIIIHAAAFVCSISQIARDDTNARIEYDIVIRGEIKRAIDCCIKNCGENLNDASKRLNDDIITPAIEFARCIHYGSYSMATVLRFLRKTREVLVFSNAEGYSPSSSSLDSEIVADLSRIDTEIKYFQELDDALTSSECLFIDGKFDNAIQVLENILRTKPKSPIYNCFAYCLKARAHLLSRRYQLAVEDCTKALTFNASSIEARKIRAQARVSMDRLTEAIIDLEFICNHDPKNIDSAIELERIKNILSQRKFSNFYNTKPNPSASSSSYSSSSTYPNSYNYQQQQQQRQQNSSYSQSRGASSSSTSIPAVMKAKTHYTKLGVDEKASDSEIKAAFRKAARIHHPDKGGDENMFKEISEAFNILSNPTLRADYDLTLQQQTYFSAFNIRRGQTRR